jgi:hypothetical protein
VGVPGSDVCLEAEASPRVSKIAASASPRRFGALPRSGWPCLVDIASAPARCLQPRLDS